MEFGNFCVFVPLWQNYTFQGLLNVELFMVEMFNGESTPKSQK
jgi:hypothetical protein